MLTHLPGFCFVFRFDNDPKVIGVAQQRISAAYEACDPKLLVQQASSLFKDFDDKRSALSESELKERDAIDALREMTGMKEDESEMTRLKRETLQKELEEKNAADQAKWKNAELLEQQEGMETKEAKEERDKKEKERLAQQEKERLAEEARKETQRLAEEEKKKNEERLAKEKERTAQIEEEKKRRLAEAFGSSSSEESD